MIDPKLLQIGIFVLVGIAAFLLIEAAWLVIANRRSYVGNVNRRLKIFNEAKSQHDVLLLLRRERGLSSEGRYRLPLVWFNRLVLQSGLGVSASRLAAMAVVPASLVFAVVTRFAQDPVLAGGGAVAAAGLMPILGLYYLRGKRRKRFEAMLPDAVDVMVRSLRAGHPLPIAITMVGREMADPIGTEFGMTADEMTYGLDLETAMSNMNARVGQEDLALLAVAISIQARTGGNLAEILHNLAGVLRARFKMRRRIKAVSAEGRASAIGLSVLPCAVFVIMNAVAPDFYGEIWSEPLTLKVLGFAVALMAVGNMIMFRMVNFRI